MSAEVNGKQYLPVAFGHAVSVAAIHLRQEVEKAGHENFVLGFKMAIAAMKEHDNEHPNIFIALEKGLEKVRLSPDVYFEHMAEVAYKMQKAK